MNADLARIVTIVPVRGLETAKTRLGEALDAEERRALVVRLLRRTIRAARAAGLETIVVSPDEAALVVAAGAGGQTLLQQEGELNEGIEAGREAAETAGASAVLVLAADIPAADARAVRTLIERARAAIEPGRALVAVAPDRHGSGTNALLLAPPSVIRPAFGPGSRRLHVAAARASGAVVVEVPDVLALDLDTPDDLLLAESARPGTGSGRHGTDSGPPEAIRG